MPAVILSGGPGAGKTTLLAELARRGYATVDESARALIAERLAQGLSPRPDPPAYARELLRRDGSKHRQWGRRDDCVFFDRSALEAIAMLHEAAALPAARLQRLIERHPYHRTVFMLPPWPEIYTTDAERDHPYTHAVAVHRQLVRWYRACGYSVHAVPCLPVAARADHVLLALGHRAADGPGRPPSPRGRPR